MESLMKYVPFVDFLLKTDKKKYYKFTNIRKWILSKKTYPSSVMNKIEEAVLTQYKNLLLENKVQIPQYITNTFAPSIDLCSDEDDEEVACENKKENRVNNSVPMPKKSKRLSTVQNQIKSKLDDDDDLEFVSINYIEKAEKKTEKQPLKENKSKEFALDESSKDILDKIDQLTADDIKLKNFVHEPVNYTYKLEHQSNDTAKTNEDIYQRRTYSTDMLFKRRTDFTNDEVVVKSLNEPLFSSRNKMETITLDSDSESEVCNDGERPSTSNAACLNINAAEKTQTNLIIPASELAKIDSKSNSSNKKNDMDKLELLCSSIDDVLPEVSDIFKELEDTSISPTNQQIENPPLATESGTESITELNANKSHSKTSSVNPEQVSKILDDISSKSNLELEILYEALECVKQINTKQMNIPESPPPAPPFLTETNITAPSIQPSIEQQQQQSQQPPMTSSMIPSKVPIAALKPKLNINDPRVKKHLQIISKSPIFSYNILNNELEESIRKICHDTVMQPSTLNVIQSNKNSSVAKNSAPGTSKSSITYGEYKRRQLEKKLEMERNREEERKAKIKEQTSSKKCEEIRSKPLITLSPCKVKLHPLNNSQNNTQQRPNHQNTENKQINNIITSGNQQNNNANDAKNLLTNLNSETNNKNAKSKKNSKCEQKLNRIYSELKCTFKGFDKIQDYIAEETNIKSNETSTYTSRTTEGEEVSERNIGLRRRSSMHALTAITVQLGMQSDNSDSELSQYLSKSRSESRSNCSSTENVSDDSFGPLLKKAKTTAEIIRPRRKSKPLHIICDETSSSDDETKTQKKMRTIFSRVPVIKLHRMSNELIRKHTKRPRKDSADTPAIHVEQNVKLRKTSEVIESLQQPHQKLPKLKKYNNDCRMTERNTAFCALCRSKPMDLTNHYKGKHKTESYVSRLDWSELDDLAINTHFAKLQPSTKKYRYDRYEVECPFCKDKITDQFINFYNHYSVHTGEYAFQCSHCNLAKPYKPDIQSHILHSKTCRKSSIQVVYRYPPQVQCIYLHYCNICNFVQLNEANVLKHLREHHDSSKAIASNVQKCILAAISDGPDACQTKESPSPLLTTETCNTMKLNANVEPFVTPTAATETVTTPQIEFKVDDDDIPVSNEPCLDDEKYTYDDMLQYLHEDKAKTAQPMTVVHNFETNIQPDGTQTITSQVYPQLKTMQIHKPIMIKTEAKDNNKEVQKSIPSSASSQLTKSAAVKNSNMVYEKYRNYPPNVKYLGLFKCMIDDCYYSTDCTIEIVTHLTEHSSDALQPYQCLQCPYCILTLDVPITPIQLVDHVRTQHGHLNFQCSICCYRSCDASNVQLHQKIHHNEMLINCEIYKLPTGHLNHNTKENINLNQLIERNIFKISCLICKNASFYHTKLLIKHLYNEHHLTSGNNLNIYSCIQCPFTVDNKNQLRIHIATRHPGERPLIYDHNSQINDFEMDIRSSLNVVDISEPVPYIDTQSSTTDADSETNISQDLKPDFKQLMFMNEETAKVRLHKLTLHTGVAPDNLYRCPEQLCGGFFSNFELWLRHMKVHHIMSECQCPHCTTTMLMPLGEFAKHFEQHRRHTYICFYCSTTSPTESLARKHGAQQHSEFRSMRFEKICFNVSYSYLIMIQSNLFQEREKFIAEFLTILDKRLKEMEENEIKNLKHQWPVRDNVAWLDDYLQNLPKRKVARRCLVKDCDFRTLKEENLYRHLNTTHTITGTQFNCSKCDYRVDKCNNLDEVFNHIKLHNEYHFLCAACTLVTSSRSKMSAHIAQHHTARDVPVIHLFRTADRRYHKIYIAFADDHITFSTMKNCFCCPEQNMSGDVFSLHLKRYHNLYLSYSCEKCTNFSFKSLKEVKPHFEQFHNSEKFKIRCELAGHSDLHALSLDHFQVQVSTRPQQNSSLISVKNEPLDVSDNDNAVLIEDDDVLIENSVKAAEQRQAELPKLKCASFSKLSKTNINTSTIPQTQQAEKPRLQCVDFNQMIEPYSILPSAPTLFQTHVGPTMAIAPILPTPATSCTPSQSYYNLNPLNFNTDRLLNNINAVPVQNNDYLIMNKSVIRPVIPNSSTQVRPYAFDVNYQPFESNRLITNNQTCNAKNIYQPNNIQSSNLVNLAYSIMPQNYDPNTPQVMNFHNNNT